jgi:4-amino-4-deoxy-L-arabinose transferase-like glycosyltransferase
VSGRHTWVPAGVAALVLAAHVVVNLTSPYGFHRDELLYLAMGRHLRLFTMDFPPFIALAARATLETLGGALVAVRLLPALAGALLVLLAGLAARRLGGGALAQATAALAVALSPLFLRAGGLFQPVVFDQLWWTLALLALLALPHPSESRLPTAAARRWLLLGLALGLGLLTKFSIAFVGLGIVAGVLLTPLRRWLLGPWPWLALAVALAVGSPSVVGQPRLDFPVVSQMSDLRGSQLERIGPADFLLGQLEMFGPLLLLAIAGLVELLRRGRAPGARAAGAAVAATVLLLMALRGKAYYVGPIYPLLFAAGGVWLEVRARSAAERGRRAEAALLRWVPLATVAAFGIVTLPFGLPLLEPAAMARYAAAIGVESESNVGERLVLPQDYADMLGWEEQVAATRRVHDSLPAADRAEVVVVGTNYGRAGAHDHFGPPLGLPPAVSPAGSYWFFGPGPRPGKVAIVIGGARDDLLPFFGTVVPAGRVTGAWRVPEEQDVTIWLARDPKRTLQEVWPALAGRN